MFVIGTDALLEAARSLVKSGVITPEQFELMEERNARLDEEQRMTRVILS